MTEFRESSTSAPNGNGALPERGRTEGQPAYLMGPESQPTPCPVAYCRAVGDHGLHDIPACLRTCGPLRPGQGREHDPACPNAKWVRA